MLARARLAQEAHALWQPLSLAHQCPNVRTVPAAARGRGGSSGRGPGCGRGRHGQGGGATDTVAPDISDPEAPSEPPSCATPVTLAECHGIAEKLFEGFAEDDDLPFDIDTELTHILEEAAQEADALPPPPPMPPPSESASENSDCDKTDDPSGKFVCYVNFLVGVQNICY